MSRHRRADRKSLTLIAYIVFPQPQVKSLSRIRFGLSSPKSVLASALIDRTIAIETDTDTSLAGQVFNEFWFKLS